MLQSDFACIFQNNKLYSFVFFSSSSSSFQVKFLIPSSSYLISNYWDCLNLKGGETVDGVEAQLIAFFFMMGCFSSPETKCVRASTHCWLISYSYCHMATNYAKKRLIATDFANQRHQFLMASFTFCEVPQRSLGCFQE
jgi:hypothetical protein